MSEDDFNRGKLEQSKAIIGGVVAMGVGVLVDCGMSNDDAADYLHEIIEQMRRMPNAWSRMTAASADIHKDEQIDQLVREHTIPPPKKS